MRNNTNKIPPDYDVMNYYLRGKHKHGLKLKQAKLISNPFLPQKQDTPSFNIYESQTSGRWRYYDFATDEGGNYLDLVMKLFNLSAQEAIRKIKKDSGEIVKYSNRSTEPVMPDENTPQLHDSVNHQPVFRNFTVKEGEYWKRYGIDLKTRKRYNVKAVKEYTGISRTGETYTIRSSGSDYIFAYDFGHWQKIYRPLAKKRNKFRYLGTKPPNYVFGFEQLPQNGDVVYITGGEKDTLTLAARGYAAIALNSETATPDKDMLPDLKSRFTSVVLLYDNDRTGLTQSEKISQTYSLPRVVLPEIDNSGKDISDYFAEGGSTDELNRLTLYAIENANNYPTTSSDFVTALELMNISANENPKLWEPFFPASGMGAIIGSSDSGKSAFCRQLALAITNRDCTFLGHTLHVTHDCVYFVSSEDDEMATAALLHKQQANMEIIPKQLSKLLFLFDCENLKEKLDRALSSHPASIVILDSFGDLFDGNDMNSNARIRGFLKDFAELSRRHRCFFLFIHHVGKRTETNGPSKHNAIGSQAFEAKMRIVLDLSTEGDRKLMSVVKGNYLSREVKKSSYVLEFNEETLTFYNTGEQDTIRTIGDKGGQKKQYINWRNIFESESILTRAIIEQRLLERCGIGKSSAGRYISDAVNDGKIERQGFGRYSLIM